MVVVARVVVGASVYVAGGYYGGMYAFNTADLSQRWFATLNQYDQFTPAVKDTFVYAYTGSYQPKLTVADATTGAVAYEIATHLLAHLDYLDEQSGALTARVEELLAPFAEHLQRLGEGACAVDVQAGRVLRLGHLVDRHEELARFSVVDGKGAIVSVTTTLNDSFGNGRTTGPLLGPRHREPQLDQVDPVLDQQPFRRVRHAHVPVGGAFRAVQGGSAGGPSLRLRRGDVSVVEPTET